MKASHKLRYLIVNADRNRPMTARAAKLWKEKCSSAKASPQIMTARFFPAFRSKNCSITPRNSSSSQTAGIKAAQSSAAASSPAPVAGGRSASVGKPIPRRCSSADQTAVTSTAASTYAAEERITKPVGYISGQANNPRYASLFLSIRSSAGTPINKISTTPVYKNRLMTVCRISGASTLPRTNTSTGHKTAPAI